MTLSLVELALVVAAVAFLLFAFTRRGRTVASVMFGGLLFLLASGLFFSIFHLQPETGPWVWRKSGTAPSVPVAFKAGEAAQPAGGLDLAPTTGERPEWVDEEPWFLREGRNGTYYTTVNSKFWASEDECLKALERAALEKTREYVDTLLEEGAGQQLVTPQVLRQQEIVHHVWTETRDFPEPTGTMYQMHAQLAFGDDVVDLFKGQWQDRVMDDRLTAAVGGAALLLVLLGTVFAYLRIDTATRGYYSGRLKLAAAAIIIVALGVAYVGADRLNLFGI